jgi:hypothetical protein
VRVYREALEALRGADLALRCAAAGYRHDPQHLEIDFLGRRFHFSVPSWELAPEGPPQGTTVGSADPDLLAERILILHYLARASGGRLSGRLVGFDQLAGGRFYGSAFRKRTEMPLAGLFAKNPSALISCAKALGGVQGDTGDASALLWPFPMVPMTLILWTGDDELPPNAKVLFDDTAEGYLSTEDIAVLGDLVIRRFKELIRS